MSKASIIGAYNTKFGNFVKRDKETREITDSFSLYDLFLEAGRGALTDAGMEAKDIGGVWVGSCAPGLFANQEHIAAFATEIDPEGLRFKPMTRCENACASGSVAIYQAVYALEAGRVNAALVIGVEKMNLLDTKGVTHALGTCSYWPEEGGKGMSFPALFAEYAKGYMAKYNISRGDMDRHLATIAALCYANGLDNPLAHFGKGGPSDKLGLVTADAILNMPPEKNPIIADPLRLHDCSLVTDGAAALVLMRTEDAKSGDKRVQIAGIGHANERMAISVRPNMHELIAGKEATRRAYLEAGVTPQDIDIAEVHDCFTINQILATEALGLSRDGCAGSDYQEGRFTRSDKCGVNLSGGLKAKGHPVGATGVSMHALAYKQLTGQPIGAALAGKQPEIAATFNVGGSSVTNCVTVLKRG
jgi:acetyl-CoA C-acetyltransferase